VKTAVAEFVDVARKDVDGMLLADVKLPELSKERLTEGELVVLTLLLLVNLELLIEDGCEVVLFDVILDGPPPPPPLLLLLLLLRRVEVLLALNLVDVLLLKVPELVADRGVEVLLLLDTDGLDVVEVPLADVP
jgi:hypothetical protein